MAGELPRGTSPRIDSITVSSPSTHARADGSGGDRRPEALTEHYAADCMPCPPPESLHSSPLRSRGVHGQSWRQERFWCRGQTCPPFVVAPNLHTTVEVPIRQRAHPGNCQRPIQHPSPNPQSGPARRSFPSPAAAAPWANW
nr:hypothetical protein JVH1_0228 [Rhodococcus sp. JVH1]